MSKARFVPVFNCELPNGSRHGVLVHYTPSYKPIGIGSVKAPKKEDSRTCYDHPENVSVNFIFSRNKELTNSDFAGVKIICKEAACPFNKKERI